MMNPQILELLECLIDEIRASGDPSEATVMLLARYESEYGIVQDYFKEVESK